MHQTQLLAWLSARRTSLKFAIVLAVASWTLGCVPLRYTSGPGAKGKVVDAGSHAPIPNAFVSITRSQGAAAQDTTSKEGEFHIRGKRSWYLLNLFSPSTSKPILQPAVLTITGGSYQTFATNAVPGTTMLDVGEVRLQPLSK